MEWRDGGLQARVRVHPRPTLPLLRCRRLLRLLALSLGLEAGYFDQFFTHPMLFLRPLHYEGRASAVEEGLFAAGVGARAFACVRVCVWLCVCMCVCVLLPLPMYALQTSFCVQSNFGTYI